MDNLASLENLRLAKGFGVEETPTLKLFCGGREVREIVGYRTLDKVVKEIKEILDRGDCYKRRSI